MMNTLAHWSLVASLLVIAGCPDRIDFNDSTLTGGPTGVMSISDSSASSTEATTSETTTAITTTFDPCQEGGTLPPETGDDTADTGNTTGSDCMQGELQCAPGMLPYLLRCVDGQYGPALPGDAYDAGDCDGSCIDNSGGASAASGCADGACICNIPCTTASASTFFCRDTDLIGWCYASQLYQQSCASRCQQVGATSGSCDSVIYADQSREEWCRCPCTETWCGDGCADCVCAADASFCLPPI